MGFPGKQRMLHVKNKPIQNVDRNHPPDGGWGWMVVFGCFLQYVIEAGLLASYGVLYVEIMNVMDIDKVSVSWIGSIRTGLYLGAAPLIVPFIKFVSCRMLTITGGILAFASLLTSAYMTSLPALLVCLGIFQGIAFSLVFVSSNIIVNHYFDKNRPIAIGIACCGAGVGITTYPLLQDILLREFGLSGTLLINSALSLHVVFSGMLYFPLPVHTPSRTEVIPIQEEKSMCNNLKGVFDFHIFKSPIFVVFILHNIFVYIGGFVPYAFLPDRAVSKGFNLNEASFLVSVIGIASSCGRVLVGTLASKLQNARPHFYVILIYISGVVTCILPLCREYEEFVMFSVGFGISSGGYICLCTVLLLDLFHRDLLASSLGFVTLAQGIGGFIGSPTSVGISEAVGSDDVIFYFSGATFILAGLFLQISLCFKSRGQEKPKTIHLRYDINNEFNTSTFDYLQTYSSSFYNLELYIEFV